MTEQAKMIALLKVGGGGSVAGSATGAGVGGGSVAGVGGYPGDYAVAAAIRYSEIKAAELEARRKAAISNLPISQPSGSSIAHDFAESAAAFQGTPANLSNIYFKPSAVEGSPGGEEGSPGGEEGSPGGEEGSLDVVPADLKPKIIYRHR